MNSELIYCKHIFYVDAINVRVGYRMGRTFRGKEIIYKSRAKVLFFTWGIFTLMDVRILKEAEV